MERYPITDRMERNALGRIWYGSTDRRLYRSARSRQAHVHPLWHAGLADKAENEIDGCRGDVACSNRHRSKPARRVRHSRKSPDLFVVFGFFGLTVDFADTHAFATISHQFAQFADAEISDLMHTNQ